MVTESIDTVTKSVVKYMLENKMTLCTAESCTGGMIAETITNIPGVSGMFPGGVCCYSEKTKQKILGVKKETLDKFTVYSAQVASEMSMGAMKLYCADYAIGVTGVAGPEPSDGLPAGTVYVSVRSADSELVRNLKLYEEYEELTREQVRTLTTLRAMQMVKELCGIQES